MRIGETVSVAHQASGGGELTQEVHRRYRVTRRQRDELLAPAGIESIVGDEESADPLADERRKCDIEVAVVAGVEDKNFLPDRTRRRPDVVLAAPFGP